MGTPMFGLSKRESITVLVIILIGAAIATWAIVMVKV
jgi:hypothetical protein